MDTYSLSDLVKATGAKRRSLQLWADREVIRPIASTADAGTGVHRLYSRKEAIVACIIQAFALRQISIGELKFISLAIRQQMTLDSADLMEGAVAGEGDTMLWYESWFQNGKWQRRVSMGLIDRPGDFDAYLPAFRNQQDSMCMTIRLETYLSKLK